MDLHTTLQSSKYCYNQFLKVTNQFSYSTFALQYSLQYWFSAFSTHHNLLEGFLKCWAHSQSF